ncbi:MAG: InlB B-repeat-containing protein, partial [Lachnospiraceae bacterium]|nr:InlB B-repeat-containing protein [Lachnospiraceae bacterium]
MARISKNRHFKIVTSFIMTAVMILSLFAGIGAIFVREDTSEVNASVLGSNGKFIIPSQSSSAELGTDANPFVVLEVVPNENMAQMGYLVSGQEPVDINKLEASDAASFLSDGSRPLTDKMTSEYGWLQWKDGDTPKKSEFANMLPESGSDEAFYTEDGVDYKIDQMTQKERGEYRQFGYYKLAGKDEEGNYKGNYKLGETITEVEGLGEGYGYYPEVGVGVPGKNKADLNETELSELDYEQIKKITNGKTLAELTEGVDYVIDSNGDIYFRVAEGTGVYSDKIYDRNTHTVKFMSSDEDDAVVYEVGGKKYEFTILAGDKLMADQIPSASAIEGHEYEYWKIKGENTKFDFNTPITDDLVLVPMYKGVMVHFVAVKDDGTPNEIIDEIELEFNSKLSQPADPDPEGYTFNGWYKDEGLTTGNEFVFGKKTKEETYVYAKYNVITYTVTFEPGSAGASAYDMPASQDVNYKQKATEPAKPKWSGHRFKEWHDSEGNKYDFNSEVTGNLVLTAVWNNEYTVSFNANGGTGAPAAQQVAAGDYAEEPTTVPTREDLTFGGWYEQNSNTKFDFAHTKINGNVELFAKWLCKVEFNSDGGTDVATQYIPYGSKATEPEDPTKEGGYEFLGWKKNTSDSSFFNFNTELTTNITLIAIWKHTSHTVTFKLNGGYIGSGSNNGRDRVVENVTHDTLLGTRYPGNPSKTSAPNRFKGWKKQGTNEYFDVTTQKIVEDFVLVAVWGYRVTFDMTEGTPQLPDVIVEAGQKLEEPDRTTFSRNKYVFIEWRTGQYSYNGTKYDFDSAVNSDLTLRARWGHTVTFNSNGGTAVETQTIEGDSRQA